MYRLTDSYLITDKNLCLGTVTNTLGALVSAQPCTYAGGYSSFVVPAGSAGPTQFVLAGTQLCLSARLGVGAALVLDQCEDDVNQRWKLNGQRVSTNIILAAGDETDCVTIDPVADGTPVSMIVGNFSWVINLISLKQATTATCEGRVGQQWSIGL